MIWVNGIKHNKNTSTVLFKKSSVCDIKLLLDLYNRLAEEEEHSAVNSFLQDLMEQEVLDSGVMEELALDVGQTRRKLRDPVVTMEARHLQVCYQSESQIPQVAYEMGISTWANQQKLWLPKLLSELH